MPDHQGPRHAAERRKELHVPSPTEEFFADLGQRGHEPLLERTDQTVRIDLREDGQTEHWRLMVRHGDLRVSRDPEHAECVITTTRDVFDQVVTGRTKPLAAWLRNQITVEGRLQALLTLERLLPSRPGAHDPRTLAALMTAEVARTDGQAAGP
jgi:putative sterol carrier protein